MRLSLVGDRLDSSNKVSKAPKRFHVHLREPRNARQDEPASEKTTSPPVFFPLRRGSRYTPSYINISCSRIVSGDCYRSRSLQGRLRTAIILLQTTTSRPIASPSTTSTACVARSLCNTAGEVARAVGIRRPFRNAHIIVRVVRSYRELHTSQPVYAFLVRVRGLPS